jgi:vacuolar-type H+-ATPase catalytic subunit A/Vma1
MKTASLSYLKKELSTLPYGEVLKICMQIVKYKKENKELLNYLLFEAGNEQEYIKNIKNEIDEYFLEINISHIYFAKKSIRKILKITNKYIRYSGHKQTEADLLIYFCIKLKASKIPIRTSTSLSNLYETQVKKIKKAVATMHEDLQFDYASEIKQLIY